MIGRDIKISRGLSKLISTANSGHFRTSDIFLDNPQFRTNYFEMYSKAQVVEIANSTL